jgi:hypothetical protein
MSNTGIGLLVLSDDIAFPIEESRPDRGVPEERGERGNSEQDRRRRLRRYYRRSEGTVNHRNRVRTSGPSSWRDLGRTPRHSQGTFLYRRSVSGPTDLVPILLKSVRDTSSVPLPCPFFGKADHSRHSPAGEMCRNRADVQNGRAKSASVRNRPLCSGHADRAI